MTEREWVRLLAWYPREWRERNGAAMVGALLDAADESGRGPTASDRRSLILGGLGERFRPERRNSVSIATLIAAVAFAAFNLFVIAWAPGIRYPGTFGPFSNPSLITAVLLAGALALTAIGRGRLGRIFALLGSFSAAALWALATTLGWLGPGLLPSLLFVGLGLLGAVRVRGAAGAALLGALALLVVSALAMQFALASFPVPTAFVELAIASAALLGAMALALVGVLGARSRQAPA